MRTKDFWTVLACNFVTIILLVEHFCGLELALGFACAWEAVALIVQINILKDYFRKPVFIRKDYTKK